MTSLGLLIRYGLVILTTGLVSACFNNDSNNNDTSLLSLALTDGAIDFAEAVNIDITGIELKSQNTTHVFSFATRRINLLTLQGSQSESLLTDEVLPVGDYQWLRLQVDSASIVLSADGGEIPLTIPSSDQTGFKLVSGFTLPVNGSASFTIDFDVRKSVVMTGPENNRAYKLKPTMRLMNNIEAGHLAGSINGSLCEPESSMAVYVFDGFDAEVDDEGSSHSPVATSLVSDSFDYEVGFLIEGDYTLALACNADVDFAESDDDVNFIAEQNATVVAKVAREYPFN